MGTRRHKRRYRGGEEFVAKPFVSKLTNPRGLDVMREKKSHEESEKKRYQDWKSKRDIEARQDMKDRESDAKMAAFNEKQKRERYEELESVRKAEEERRKSAEEEPSKKKHPCVEVLKSAGVTGKTKKDLTASVRKFSMKNHPDKGGDTAKFQEVYGCYEKKLAYLEDKGGRRRTRRRKSHRRRR
jgi:hypothetical protein